MQIMKNQENVQLFWQPKEEKTVFLRLFCTSDSLKNLQNYSNLGKTKLKDVIVNTGKVVWKQDKYWAYQNWEVAKIYPGRNILAKQMIGQPFSCLLWLPIELDIWHAMKYLPTQIIITSTSPS